jgi:hypothetical protein
MARKYYEGYFGGINEKHFNRRGCDVNTDIGTGRTSSTI